MSAADDQHVLDHPRAIATHGVIFSYLEQGTGHAIVLLHGVGSGARSWRTVMPRLGRSFRVVAWDAPGYASSTPVDPERPDPSDYAERLRLLVDALGIDRFHVVGHSLGAITAARFAAEHPGRVTGVTLACPSTGHARLPQEERDKLRNARLGDLGKIGPREMAKLRGPRLVSAQASEEVRQSVIETMALIRPDGYQQAVGLLSGADTRADLERLSDSVPVQFIYGDQDVITPPAGTLALATSRSAAAIHKIEGAGHAVYLEKPELFSDLLASFARFCVEKAPPRKLSSAAE
jgi:pimeloyl-ACP methyl ester carboxylesterase